jgi:hypothetical protein
MKQSKKTNLEQTGDSGSEKSSLAVKLSWAVLILVLLAWGIYDLATEGALNAPMIILSLGLTVYWTSRLILQYQQREDREP